MYTTNDVKKILELIKAMNNLNYSYHNIIQNEYDTLLFVSNITGIIVSIDVWNE